MIKGGKVKGFSFFNAGIIEHLTYSEWVEDFWKIRKSIVRWDPEFGDQFICGPSQFAPPHIGLRNRQAQMFLFRFGSDMSQDDLRWTTRRMEIVDAKRKGVTLSQWWDQVRGGRPLDGRIIPRKEKRHGTNND